MSRESPAPWGALPRLTGNLALGLAPFALLAGLHPAIGAKQAAAVWLCFLAAAALAGCLHLGQSRPTIKADPVFRRLLSCILLGSSLAAIPWNAQNLPLFPVAAGAGFVTRWWLYLLETRDLIRADRQKQALPCLATRLRRSITWITGALIPLLVLTGLPAVPLLVLSCVLTLFNQWTVGCELKLGELQVVK